MKLAENIRGMNERAEKNLGEGLQDTNKINWFCHWIKEEKDNDDIKAMEALPKGKRED